MTAGLPGIGLSGLFMLLSALVMPVVQLVRSVRGTSVPGQWRTVVRQWSMAVSMVGFYAVVALTTSHVLSRSGIRLPSQTGWWARHGIGPVAVLAISLIVLLTLLTVLTAARRVWGRGGRPASCSD